MIKIGVVMGSKPSSFAKDPHYSMEIRYFTALEKAGALAVPITYSNIEEQLKDIDGVLMPGGDFVIPNCYFIKGQKAPYEDEGVWFDAYMAISNYCLANNIPVLGICGGMQVLSVLLNCKLSTGNLKHRKVPSSKLIHGLSIKKDSHLYNIFEQEEFKVNSIHQEAVAELSDKVIATGIAEDGIVEAIESKEHDFAVGVQWHPECLPGTEQDKIFDYFIQQCKK